MHHRNDSFDKIYRPKSTSGLGLLTELLIQFFLQNSATNFLLNQTHIGLIDKS